MGLGLHRVVYVSLATRPDPALAVLADVLATSGRNNALDGLTGALLVTPDRFLQVLEGAAQDLDRALRRISDDPRHHGLQILDRRAVTARRFGQWTMVAARITPTRADRMDAVIRQASQNPDAAMGTIHALVIEQLAVAAPSRAQT